ncbi:hypothetical protein BH23BAC3_BH23BAC3_11390 [soil metagenome]
MTIILTFIIGLLALDPPAALSEGNQTGHQEQPTSYYLLDHSSYSIDQIPHTIASVDSLLKIGTEQQNHDSRESFNAARQALTISYDIDYKEGIAKSYNLIGIKYLDFGDHELAHYHYLQAMSIEASLGNQEAIANILNNMARVYVEQEDYQEAAKYLEESIITLKTINKDQQALSATNNLGVIHRRQGNYKKALNYFWDTYERSLTEEPDSLLYIIATLNIGNTYRNMGSYQRAQIHLKAAREYIERHDYIPHLIFTDIVLGELYKDLGEYETALNYAVSALELARQGQYRERIKEGHLLIAEIHEQTGNYNKAFEHFRLYHIVSDTLQNMQRGERIQELQARFDVEQKEREIDLLNKEAALQQAKLTQHDQLRSFLISGVLLLLVIIGLLYRTNRQKKLSNQSLKDSRSEIEKQNEELSALNKEKDEFISIAAHDLRNPLSSINMAVDLINDEENIDRKTIREYTDLIKISSARMLNLINSVLQIHSISDSSKHKSVKKLDVNQLVLEAIQHFRKPAESKKIKLKVDLSKEKTVLTGESDNVLRIFDNLISNAIKYSPDGTAVTVSTRLISNRVQIAVKDQGPGIRKKDLHKLFGKFARLPNKPTGNESSTGLGLFIVKKIATSMGGRVWCESEPGNGSVFIVELPATENNSQRTSLRKRKPYTVFEV